MQEMYQWEEGLLEYMMENDIDYVEGRDIYLDESLGKLLRGVAGNAMPALKAGYRRVKKGGKWVLEKIKKPSKGADAVDSATPPAKTRESSILGKDGKPLKVKDNTPAPKPDPKKKVRKRPDAPKPDAPEPPPKPQSRGRIKKALGTAAVVGGGALAYANRDKIRDAFKNRNSDTSTKPETSSPGSSSPGSSSPGGGGGSTKPGGSGPKPTPSPQTTQNPKQRVKNRSSWNKPVGRREHIAANNRSIRREETSIIRDLTAELFEGLPEPKVNYLKDMDPYDPRRRLQQLAPGSPLPPANMRPGIPEFYRKAKKDDKKKDKKND